MRPLAVIVRKGRRPALSLTAQSLSSLASLTLSLTCASSLPAEKYGYFAILFSGYALMVGTTRVITAEILLFRYSSYPRAQLTDVANAATSANLLVAGGMSGVGVGACLLLGASPAATIFFAGFPLLSLHEQLRFVLISAKQSGAAVAVDAAAVLSLIGALFWAANGESLTRFIVAWLASEMTAVAVGLVAVRPRLRFSSALGWLTTEARRGSLYLGDFWITNGLLQGTAFLVAAIAGLKAAGAVRAAQSLLTPALLITRGALVAIGPEARRSTVAGAYPNVARASLLLSVASVAVVVASAVTMAVLPSSVVVQLLGETTDGAMQALPWAACALAASGAAIGAGLFLRAVDLMRVAFTAKVVTFPFGALLVTGGALTASAQGALAGLAASEAVRALINWWQVSKYLRARRADR